MLAVGLSLPGKNLPNLPHIEIKKDIYPLADACAVVLT